jgi:hypothetical protein
MVSGRRVAAFLAVLCATAAPVGCSPSTTESPTSSTSATSATTSTKSEPTSTYATSAAGLADLDLSQLTEVRDSFPPDFVPAPPSAPRKVQAEYAHLVGEMVSYGKPFTVDPPHCRALLAPVEAQAGADAMGVSAEGPDKQSIVVSVYNPVTISDALPSTGCDRMTFVVESAVPDGAAERLAAPNIDGAASYALKVDFTVTNPNSTQPLLVDYFYVAILDNRTYVEVQARMNPGFQAEPLLPDLLTKAVNAIRG